MSKNLVFLCSGGGGNLRFLHAAIELGWLSGWRLSAVIADRACAAAEFAEARGLASSLMDFRPGGQPAVARALADLRPDAIISNVHRILSDAIVQQFAGRLINLHYSLLPAFGGVIGVRAVEQALDYGERLIGVTVHQVSEQLDKGRPIVQIAWPIGTNDSLAEVMDRQFRAGAIALLAALLGMDGTTPANAGPIVSIGQRPGLISPAAHLPAGLQDEAFWARLK